MNYNKKSIEDIDVAGKRVLCRCDFNVPTKNGVITSDKRIVAAMPTIKYLVDHNAKVILCSHMGKPKGEWKPELSLKVVADRISELLGKEVIMAADVAGEDAKAKAAALKDGDVMLLENTRFEKGETKNDPELSKALASLADVFVNDAFGTAHRAHASTAGVAAFVKDSVSGFLMEKELEFLGRALENPEHPFVAILGGAKVSDKIGVIENLIDKVDALLVGGGMAYTFLKSEGVNTGRSLCEDGQVPLAAKLSEKARQKGVKLLLPVDHVVAYSTDKGEHFVSSDIPDDMMGVDIGPKTAELFAKALSGAKTVVWNGPMGVFENPDYAAGTFAVARAVAESGATSIVGGCLLYTSPSPRD